MLIKLKSNRYISYEDIVEVLLEDNYPPPIPSDRCATITMTKGQTIELCGCDVKAILAFDEKYQKQFFSPSIEIKKKVELKDPIKVKVQE